MNRWSIFIDIEGFSNLYESAEAEAFRRLNNLIEDIYKIGNDIFRREPNRLFVHQLGDGFVIISSLPEENFYRPISISLALMKSALLKGGVSKSGISEGDFADVQGMWPTKIRDNTDDCATADLGEGIMKLFTVMGNGLINSNKAVEKADSGPQFVIDKKLKYKIPPEITINRETDNLLYINWIKNETDLSKEILKTLGHEEISNDQLKFILRKYIEQNDIQSENWIKNAKEIMQNT